MAVTSIWRVKGWLGKVVLYVENPDKTKEPDVYHPEKLAASDRESLTDVISYAVNMEKTSRRETGSGLSDDEGEQIREQYVSGINCSVSTARMEMLAVKKRYSKEDGVIAYHGYQSFAPGECTPDMAHEIGMRLARELWGERYQVLVATHLDKANHLHNHFVVNSVSFVDGKKYHRTKQDYRDMRCISDRLCREYGLSVIREQGTRRSRSYGEWRAEQADRPTYAGMMRADVDEAIRQARTEKQFFFYLREKGYTFKFGKDITLKAAGRERGLKLARNFGSDYTMDAIRERILLQEPVSQNDFYVQPGRSGYSEKKSKTWHVYAGERPKRKIGGLRGLYLHYCYFLGILLKRKPPVRSRQVHVLFREELLKLHTIAEETRLLCHYGIDTAEQLFCVQKQLEDELAQFTGERKHLQNQGRRTRDPDRMKEIKAEIIELNGMIAEKRKRIKLCQGIAERSSLMREKIKAIHQEQNQKKEARSYERIGRSG